MEDLKQESASARDSEAVVSEGERGYVRPRMQAMGKLGALILGAGSSDSDGPPAFTPLP